MMDMDGYTHGCTHRKEWIELTNLCLDDRALAIGQKRLVAIRNKRSLTQKSSVHQGLDKMRSTYRNYLHSSFTPVGRIHHLIELSAQPSIVGCGCPVIVIVGCGLLSHGLDYATRPDTSSDTGLLPIND